MPRRPTSSTLKCFAGKLPPGLSGAVVPDRVFHCPSPDTMSVLQDRKQTSSPFLQAAGIMEGSAKHKDLTKTVRALFHQYLHPLKRMEAQASEVDRLVADAQDRLPWLRKYEDGWPARVYVERYVESRRHRIRDKRARMQKLQDVYEENLGVSDDVVSRPLVDMAEHLKRGHDSIVREFLSSLRPSLEHCHDAFVELGIKDQKTLQAFVSWPQATQAQFLDGDRGVLRLTSLEKMGLLVGCGLLAHKAAEKSLGSIVKPGYF